MTISICMVRQCQICMVCYLYSMVLSVCIVYQRQMYSIKCQCAFIYNVCIENVKMPEIRMPMSVCIHVLTMSKYLAYKCQRVCHDNVNIYVPVLTTQTI